MINQKRALDFFKNICRIPSKTKNEKEINAFLKNILTEMGFECWEDKAAQETGGNANNLYGRLKGDPAYKSVCFMAHTDSVQNLDNLVIIEEGNIIRSDGNT
ncbi:MAG: peptidase M20, partial [Armatimonadetes bacterium]|nr:peptidase M20 [Candidatus Hippobium faecium]